MAAATNELILTLLGIGWIVLALWLLFVTVRIQRIAKRQRVIIKAGENEDFVASVEKSLGEVTSLNSSLEELKDYHVKLGPVIDSTIRHVGLVRFDAFDDIGGKLSFAVALLNNQGDGVIISTINGRQDSRSYAKLVKNGDSAITLSTEERKAISEALSEGMVGVK